MTGRILGTYQPQSPEWWEARRRRIGGSDIAAVCGWSPWRSRTDLLAAKTSGTDGDTETTPKQERGIRLEQAGLEWLAARHDLSYDPARSAATWLHDVHDWAMYSPDGVTTGDELVEIKTTSDRSAERGWGRAGSDRVPIYYAAQVQWGMGILGLDVTWLAVIHGATNGRPDLGLAVYRVERNQDVFAELLRRGQRFIDEITTGSTSWPTS